MSLRLIFQNLHELVGSIARDTKALSLLILNERRFEGYIERGLTTADLFRMNVSRTPNKPCIIYDELVWTFQDLEEYSNRIGNLFQKEYGLRKGDCVAVLVENCPEFIGIWLGLSKIGVISAFINTNLKSQQLVHTVTSANAKVLIYSNELESTSVIEVKEQLSENLKYVMLHKGIPMIANAACLENLLESMPKNVVKPLDKITPKDTIMYVYTSGTTGLPKPAIIKHDRYIGGGFGFFKGCGLKQSDRVYVTLPLYHSNGTIIGVGTSIVCGTTVVLRKKFSATNFWKDAIKYKCTAFVYVGEICRFLINQPKSELDKAHFIRKAIGNGMRLNVWKEFNERFNVDCYEFYAASEGNCTMVNINCKMGACGFVPLLNTMYKILPIALIRIDDQMNPIRDEKGLCIECKPNEKGLLVGIIKNTTKSSFNGYANNEEATNKKIIEDVFEKGQRAFNSGDLMMRDFFGYMYFCDRLGDTYRWRGENVSTVEVENVISSILNSREVVVYGVEVPGEEGRAGMASIMVENDDGLNLKEFSTQIKSSLPSYSRPLFLRLVKEIEHTGTFKAKKSSLVDQGYNIDLISKEELQRLYYLDPKESAYKELTNEAYEQIKTGKLRF